MKTETFKGHTPGPWEFVKTQKLSDHEPDRFHVYSQPDKEKMYTSIAGVDNEIDARLIAYATTLLKEREELIEALEELLKEYVDTDFDLVGKSEALILKNKELLNRLGRV